ncbi:putative peptidase A1 family protein [Lyophyllum shimeji]|uniref:Peptidase A1 family protein n=1 Tax=Lyophyllum shimeji TaxID=47721 RepID=A0A9P3USJ2_LYOSH|nr:putative peptidase A1 family protein [Lyophyllum shimeji]
MLLALYTPLFFALLPFASAAGVYKLKFIKSQSTASDLAFDAAHLAEKALTLTQNLAYSAKISLGTPPQQARFHPVFFTSQISSWSTMTPDLAPFGCRARDAPSKHARRAIGTKVNGKKFAIQYGTGFVEGFYSQDMLRVSDLSVQAQIFGETFQESRQFEVAQYDGIFGLAYDSIAPNHTTPSFYNMSLASSSSAVSTGLAFTGKITYAPVRQRAYWEVELEQAKLGNTTAPLKNNGAAINTGISFIVMPTKTAVQFKAIIGAKKNPQGLNVVPCSTVPSLPLLTFYLDGKRYPSRGSDYIFYGQASKVCISGFIGLDINIPAGSFCILGDAFLRRYFTVHNLATNEFGFALSK